MFQELLESISLGIGSFWMQILDTSRMADIPYLTCTHDVTIADVSA
jgi:hypothetical protein